MVLLESRSGTKSGGQSQTVTPAQRLFQNRISFFGEIASGA
jgi:hypothetical protein